MQFIEWFRALFNAIQGRFIEDGDGLQIRLIGSPYPMLGRVSCIPPVQEHWVDCDDPGFEIVGNIQLTRIMGGDIRME